MFLTLKGQEYRHGIKLGTQIPLQYNIMYEFQPVAELSFNVGLGAIAEPHPTILLSAIEKFKSSDKQTIELIKKSYESSFIYEGGVNYHIKSYYLRLLGQVIHLSGNASYDELIRIYSGLNLGFRINGGIDINSRLIQAGLLAGHRFEFRNSRHQIHSELSISKTVGTKNKFKTDSFLDTLNIVQTLYAKFDNDIDSFFKKNSLLPSLNIYYVYKF